MFRVIQTEAFQRWERSLRDQRARAAIAARISRLSFGPVGDVKSIAGSLSEMRAHYGPGYCIYFVRRGNTVIVLLCAGNKASQRRDIEIAMTMAKELDEFDE